jgi:type III restriction enzyme
MNRIAQSIKNRLSLRLMQADSLNILAEQTDRLTLKKHTPYPSQEGNKKSPLSGGDFVVSSVERFRGG